MGYPFKLRGGGKSPFYRKTQKQAPPKKAGVVKLGPLTKQCLEALAEHEPDWVRQHRLRIQRLLLRPGDEISETTID